MARWSIGPAAASFVFMAIVPGRAEWGVRAFGLFFASAVSGYLARSALYTAEAWLRRDYLTVVWMLLWTGIKGFMVYSGLTIAIVGLQHYG